MTFYDFIKFGILNFGHWDLPFDLAQGGESFDSAQDREPVERLVEPFDIWDLLFEIFFSDQLVCPFTGYPKILYSHPLILLHREVFWPLAVI